MRRFDVAWLIFWGVVSSIWCLTAARELSATVDEPFYAKAGLNSWRTGSNFELMKAGTMPLPVDAQYLPIHLWERCRGEPFDAESDLHVILPYARATNLVFWWLLLTYGSLLAHRVGGPTACRFAVVLLATEPSLLGHACLATTDIAVTAMILVFAYYYDRGRDGGRIARWFLPGVLYGLAMAAKVSALLFVPIVILAVEVPRWVASGAFRPPTGTNRLGHLWSSTSQYRLDSWKIFVVGMVVMFAYCGTDWKPQPKIVAAADALPADGRWTPALQSLAHHASVFPNASEAIQYQFRRNVCGHGAYIVGEYHTRAAWYYFPVALSIKLTLPVLLLALLLLTQPRSLCTSLGLATILLLVFSLNCRVQIGIRLVFPLVALLLLALATGLARGISEQDVRLRWAWLAMLTFACAAPAVAIWPDGLRYANELWGGPEETCRHLSDSNADWGQGLIELDRAMALCGQPRAHVWYYGLDQSFVRDTDRCLPLHLSSHFDIRSPADVWQHVRGKVVAVSTTLLYGNPAITPSMPYSVEFFHRQTPIGRTRCYFVYDFR